MLRIMKERVANSPQYFNSCLTKLAAVIFCAIFLFVGFATSAHAATYYWVGGTGTWDTSTTTNWASSSGGAGGAGVPTSVDSVVFDSSCGTGTSTIVSNISVTDITISNGNIIIDQGTSSLSVSGIYSQSAGKFISPPTSVLTVSGQFNFSGGIFERFTGSGTSGSHYLVYDIYGLQGMNSYPSAYFDLNNNIDATVTKPSAQGGNNWNSGAGLVPVGNSSRIFTGAFDGKGYTVTNLYINLPSTNNVGLFGYATTRSIGNVNMVGVNITGSGYVGSLVGWSSATISSTSVSGNVTGVSSVGGIVGRNSGASFTNCYFSGSVSGNNAVGGIIGKNVNSTVSYSYSIADVFGVADNNGDTYYIGGLIGWNQYGPVSYSYAKGSVSANRLGGNVGGFAGRNQQASISNSYATGNVSGYATVGGFIGWNQNVGGTVSYSYSTGRVTGVIDMGGFVGYNEPGSYTKNFWDITTSGTTTGVQGGNLANVTGTTTSLMKMQSTFTSWNFSTIWSMPGADSYPHLSISRNIIAASAGSNGSISPNGVTSLANAANQTFTITPYAHYYVADVLVDDVSVGATTTYTFSNITADHTISATFATTTHTITSSAGSDGSITPNGANTVNDGSDLSFTITPNSGYGIADVLVDGTSVGAITSYTFTNITTDHTISATFSFIPVSHGGSQASASTLRALGLSNLITPNTPDVPTAPTTPTPIVPGCPAGYVCRATTPPSLQGAPASQSNTTTFTRNLTYKSSGSDVTTLQSILNREGFLKVSPTGYYGPITVAAVRAYQKAHNIPTTGTVGPLTKVALGK